MTSANKSQGSEQAASAKADVQTYVEEHAVQGDARADALVAELREMQNKVAKLLGREGPEKDSSTRAA